MALLGGPEFRKVVSFEALHRGGREPDRRSRECPCQSSGIEVAVVSGDIAMHIKVARKASVIKKIYFTHGPFLAPIYHR